MPRNGSGNYSLPQAPFVPATTISSSAVNSDLSDIASALTQSVSADGQTTITGPIKFSAGTAAAPGLTFSGVTNQGIFSISSSAMGVSVGGAQVAQFTAGGLATTGGTASTVPIGTVVDFAGSSAPSGWALCFGQAVSRTSFATLFSLLGTTYGAGDGVTTFNLPDCRGRATYGQDNMGGSTAGRISTGGGNYDGTVLGNSGGAQNHTLTTNEMPSHNHTNSVTDNGHSHAATSGSFVVSAAGNTYNTTGAGGGNISSLTASATTGITVSINAIGGGAAHTVLGPSIIFNKIIFTGP